MKTISAILQMIDNCISYPGFKGVFYTSKKQQPRNLIEIVFMIKDKLRYADFEIKTYNNNRFLVYFNNGSYFDIINMPNANFRGRRYHKICVDSMIPDPVVYTTITPMLCNYISPDGIKNSKIPITYHNFDSISEEYNKYMEVNSIMTTSIASAFNYAPLLKPANDYTTPYATIDKDNKRILLYKATGIDTFEYEKEFVNRTKETFLNIKGECDWYDGAYKNSVNIHLAINTDVYNGYEVAWESGILVVTLYEIVNKEPEFNEIGPF